MQDAELLVQCRHLLAVWRRVPTHLAVLLLLSPPLNNAGLGRWQKISPVGQSTDEGSGQRDQRTPSVGRVENSLDAAGGAEGTLAGQGHGEDGGQNRLHAEVPGESAGLEI